MIEKICANSFSQSPVQYRPDSRSNRTRQRNIPCVLVYVNIITPSATVQEIGPIVTDGPRDP